MEIWTSLVTKASTSRADHVGEQFTLIGSLQVGVDYPCREPFIFTRLANWGKSVCYSSFFTSSAALPATLDSGLGFSNVDGHLMTYD